MNVAVLLVCRHCHPNRRYAPDDHVLMLKSANGGLWGFPGAEIGDHESPMWAARRIAYEQTGISVDEVTPWDSDDENCVIFRADVRKDFKIERTELHDNDMWASPAFVLTTPPKLHAPGVLAAMKQLGAA